MFKTEMKHESRYWSQIYIARRLETVMVPRLPCIHNGILIQRAFKWDSIFRYLNLGSEVDRWWSKSVHTHPLTDLLSLLLPSFNPSSLHPPLGPASHTLLCSGFDNPPSEWLFEVADTSLNALGMTSQVTSLFTGRIPESYADVSTVSLEVNSAQLSVHLRRLRAGDVTASRRHDVVTFTTVSVTAYTASYVARGIFTFHNKLVYFFGLIISMC